MKAAHSRFFQLSKRLVLLRVIRALVWCVQSKVVDLEERLSGLDKKNAMLAISNDTLAAEKKAAEATSEALKKQAVVSDVHTKLTHRICDEPARCVVQEPPPPRDACSI